MATSASVNILDKQDLYMQVRDRILDYAIEHGLGPHSQLPTNQRFGRMFDVSALTVQRAMKLLAQEQIVYSRRGRGTFILEMPGAPTAVRTRSQLLACVVPSIESNTVAATVFALDDLIFDSNGEHLIVANGQFDAERELRLFDSLLSRGVDAIIYQPHPLIQARPVFARAIDAKLQAFLAAGIPVILIDEFGIRGRYDTVVPDEAAMCELAVKHLTDLGHRRLLFFGDTDIFKAKIEAFQKATDEFGLTSQQIRIVPHNVEDIHDEPPEDLQAVLNEGWPFTGIVAATDHFALACIDYLTSLGIKCPSDVSVIGADNLEAIRHLNVPLTTIWCQPMEVAQQVHSLLVDRLKPVDDLRKLDPRHFEMVPELVARGTTAKPLVKFQ